MIFFLKSFLSEAEWKMLLPHARSHILDAACLRLQQLAGARGECARTNTSSAESATPIMGGENVVCVCVCVHPIENITADLLKELITGGKLAPCTPPTDQHRTSDVGETKAVWPDRLQFLNMQTTAVNDDQL